MIFGAMSTKRRAASENNNDADQHLYMCLICTEIGTYRCIDACSRQHAGQSKRRILCEEFDVWLSTKTQEQEHLRTKWHAGARYPDSCVLFDYGHIADDQIRRSGMALSYVFVAIRKSWADGNLGRPTSDRHLHDDMEYGRTGNEEDDLSDNNADLVMDEEDPTNLPPEEDIVYNVPDDTPDLSELDISGAITAKVKNTVVVSRFRPKKINKDSHWCPYDNATQALSHLFVMTHNPTGNMWKGTSKERAERQHGSPLFFRHCRSHFSS